MDPVVIPQNKNKSSKISEFDLVKLKNFNSSYMLVPLSLYDYGTRSYVNCIVNLKDVIKYAYTYATNYTDDSFKNLWEYYDPNYEEPEEEPVIYDLNVLDPFDRTFQG